MKLSVDLNALWENANKMGDYRSTLDIEASISEFELDQELESSRGVEVAPSEINFDNGLLEYKGRQVVLFIPDHSFNITSLLEGTAKSHNKFHVAECRTLADMQSRGRYDRYRVTNNLDGMFHVYGVSRDTGQHQEGEYPLTVCKNCLDYLSYQGYSYKKSYAVKEEIYRNFSMEEFLTQYSTLFKRMPKEISRADKGGYVDNWKDISDNYRAKNGFHCERCAIDLSEHKNLLHTHHKNGDKTDNDDNNLEALCLDCHRKQPNHGYMRITHQDMAVITRLRREIGALNVSNWDEVRGLADKCLDGVLRSLETSRYAIPEVGYEIANSDGAVVCELELAWPSKKLGIAIDEDSIVRAREFGWRIMSVGEAHKWVN